MLQYRPLVLCQCDPDRTGYSLQRLGVVNGIFWVCIMALLLALMLLTPAPNKFELHTTGITQQIFHPKSWAPQSFYQKLAMSIDSDPTPIEVSFCKIPGKGQKDLPLARTVVPVRYVGRANATYYTWWSRVLYETQFKLNKNSSISCAFTPSKNTSGFNLYIIQGDAGLRDIADGAPIAIVGLLAQGTFTSFGYLPPVTTTKSGPVYCVATATSARISFAFDISINQSIVDSHLNATCVRLWTNDTRRAGEIRFNRHIRYLLSVNNTLKYQGPTVHIWGQYNAALWYAGVILPVFTTVILVLVLWGMHNWWIARQRGYEPIGGRGGETQRLVHTGDWNSNQF